jgi:hypothetical protein
MIGSSNSRAWPRYTTCEVFWPCSVRGKALADERCGVEGGIHAACDRPSAGSAGLVVIACCKNQGVRMTVFARSRSLAQSYVLVENMRRQS